MKMEVAVGLGMLALWRGGAAAGAVLVCGGRWWCAVGCYLVHWALSVGSGGKARGVSVCGSACRGVWAPYCAVGPGVTGLLDDRSVHASWCAAAVLSDVAGVANVAGRLVRSGVLRVPRACVCVGAVDERVLWLYESLGVPVIRVGADADFESTILRARAVRGEVRPDADVGELCARASKRA